jgi:hypothetical protein
VDEFHLLFKSFYIEDRATLALGCFIVFALSIIGEVTAEWLHRNQKGNNPKSPEISNEWLLTLERNVNNNMVA